VPLLWLEGHIDVISTVHVITRLRFSLTQNCPLNFIGAKETIKIRGTSIALLLTGYTVREEQKGATCSLLRTIAFNGLGFETCINESAILDLVHVNMSSVIVLQSVFKHSAKYGTVFTESKIIIIYIQTEAQWYGF
jgi:hypothetical protein